MTCGLTSSYTVELHSRMVVARSTEFETFYTKNRRGDCSWLQARSATEAFAMRVQEATPFSSYDYLVIG